jgi:hypothetical protein
VGWTAFASSGAPTCGAAPRNPVTIPGRTVEGQTNNMVVVW